MAGEGNLSVPSALASTGNICIPDTEHVTFFFLRVNFITGNEILKAHTVARS